MLTLANQPRVHELCAELFGDRVALVDYIMPGFALAKAAADVFEANPGVEGMLLVNHGHFTFGATAKEAYERMIDHVTAVEELVAAARGVRDNANPSAPVAHPTAREEPPATRERTTCPTRGPAVTGRDLDPHTATTPPRIDMTDLH